MKTALSTAIEQIQKERDYLKIDPFLIDAAFMQCINIMKELLPTEREQIENAYGDGYRDGVDLDESFENSQHYYNKTYGNESEN